MFNVNSLFGRPARVASNALIGVDTAQGSPVGHGKFRSPPPGLQYPPPTMWAGGSPDWLTRYPGTILDYGVQPIQALGPNPPGNPKPVFPGAQIGQPTMWAGGSPDWFTRYPTQDLGQRTWQQGIPHQQGLPQGPRSPFGGPAFSAEKYANGMGRRMQGPIA